ncbi:MAG: hypothetical protein GX443_12275 [Deltaproteobacteria bacterium]|nr:hypothetical protein [Deltaproteobacteria bacterium]
MINTSASGVANPSARETIRIGTTPEGLATWFPLLGQGFLVKTRIGRNLRQVLCEEIGLSPEYLEERVQTVFLDGKAIDDLEASVVGEASVVALSAAMPGFVGAAYRKGGYYRVMRSGTTYDNDPSQYNEKPGFFKMKLFNLVAAELGESFLRVGILLDSLALTRFLANQPDSFWKKCREIRIDDQLTATDELLTHLEGAPQHLVSLQVLATP